MEQNGSTDAPRVLPQTNGAGHVRRRVNDLAPNRIEDIQKPSS